jgi:hypothetical protein
MPEDKEHSLFTQAIISCVRLRLVLVDPHFADLLERKTQNYITAFVAQNSSLEDNVAQYSSRIYAINALLEVVDQVEHLKLADSAVLLPCRELLLSYKLQTLKLFKLVKFSKIPAKQDDLREIEQSIAPKITIQNKFPQRTKKANRVREEILGFIKQTDRVRTKDILSQFGAISPRTIKRSLKELVVQGLIQKESDRNSTHYSSRL